AQAAAENHLLAEKVRLGFLGKSGLHHARTRAADAVRVGKRAIESLAGCVLVDRDDAGNALARLELPTHERTGSLRSDHCNVDVGGGNDLAVMNIEAVRKENQRARF